MASGLQKRLSLNYFDPEVQTRNPPPPPKKEKKRTSILEIAQRSQSTPAEENASIFSGVETKRRQSRLRKSKVKGHPGSKSVDYAVYRLDTPNLAAKVNQDTDIDLSFSDLGYLAHLYKNSLNRGPPNNDNIDSPATTKRKFCSYVGHSERSLNPDLYESVNHDLMQIPKERRRKESLFVQSPRKSLAEEVNNRPSISLTPNLIVMKKSPGSRRSLPSTKRVKGEQRKVNKRKSGDNRKVAKHKIDLRDPLPADKNNVQYLVEPPPPNFVIAKRDSRKSTASSRNSVRFSVVEDAMELAEQLDKSKKGKKIKKEPGERRKSQTSYTEAEFVEGSSDRDQEIEALRIQLQKNLATQPALRDISPDSDYISNSSNRHSRSNSSSSSGSSSSSSSGSSSSESDSRSSSSSSSSGSSSRSSSRSRSSSSSGSSRSSSSSRSESDQERGRKKKYEVKSQDKQTKEKHEDGKVHDGKELLGEASKPRTKTSIVCVIL